jgi:hypothetical protein
MAAPVTVCDQALDEWTTEACRAQTYDEEAHDNLFEITMSRLKQ